MAAPSLLPRTAPFGDDDRVSLDRVFRRRDRDATRLARGLSRRPRSPRRGPAGRPDAPARAAEPLTILFASESGNAERLAQDIAKLARKNGFKPQSWTLPISISPSSPRSRTSRRHRRDLGRRRSARRAVHAYADLMGEQRAAPRRTTFAVLALGDTAYVEFCAVGKAIDARLAELGAMRAVDRIDCDLDFEAPASAWIKATLETLAPPLESRRKQRRRRRFREPRRGRGRAASRSRRRSIDHIDLNSSRSDKETIPPRARLRRRGAGLRARRFARTLSRRTIRASSMRCWPRRVLRASDAVRHALRYGARYHDAFAQDASSGSSRRPATRA